MLWGILLRIGQWTSPTGTLCYENSVQNCQWIRNPPIRGSRLENSGRILETIFCLKKAISDCTPVKIWMLNRHGTRLPKARDIKGLRALESVGWCWSFHYCYFFILFYAFQQVRNKVITNYEKRKPKSDVGGLCKGDLVIHIIESY